MAHGILSGIQCTPREAPMMRSGTVLKNTGASAGCMPSPTWRVVVNSWGAAGGVGTEESMVPEVSSLAFYVFFVMGRRLCQKYYAGHGFVWSSKRVPCLVPVLLVSTANQLLPWEWEQALMMWSHSNEAKQQQQQSISSKKTTKTTMEINKYEFHYKATVDNEEWE
eukprot:scaffold56766_cov38-Attheya_sp.AAC.1